MILLKEIIIECPDCEGTGLYVGLAERKGAAVVCHTCKGTGKTKYHYNDFTGRKKKENVVRVFAQSCGYVHTAEDYVGSNETIAFSKGGCTYEEWLNGADPKPVKDLYCPYIWDNRGTGNEPRKRCAEGIKGFGYISNCQFFSDKASCWVEYETLKNN